MIRAAKGAGNSRNLDTFLSFNDFASLSLFAVIYNELNVIRFMNHSNNEHFSCESCDGETETKFVSYTFKRYVRSSLIRISKRKCAKNAVKFIWTATVFWKSKKI